MSATATIVKVKFEPALKRLHFSFEGVERCLVQEFQTHTILRKLEVMPLFRGHGVGSRVLSELKARRKPIHLIPYPDDPNRYDELIRFYQGNGFAWDETQDYMVWSP
jgi:GNAT superfamily N-acetyltransferase